MQVVEPYVTIDTIELYAEGAEFGETGAYEILRGRAAVRLDPAHPDNRAIADIDRAMRDDSGRVAVESDIVILRPVERRANGSVLTVIPNRGALGLLPFSTGDAGAASGRHPHPGDAYLLRHGWTVVWIGWQWDIDRDGVRVGCSVPFALDDSGAPLGGVTSVRIEPTQDLPDHPLAEPTSRSPEDVPAFGPNVYRVSDLDDPDARLEIIDDEGGETEVDRDRWGFARSEGGRRSTDDGRVWVEGGLRAGVRYRVTYRTRSCPVVGLGLLAVREIAGFLRHNSDPAKNPIAFAHGSAHIAHGGSQSGRFLLEYLRRTCNRTAEGARVFDLVYPVVAGSNRGQFAQRFGKPGGFVGEDLGELPPHALGGKDGLLDSFLDGGARPKILSVNSGAEYWRGDAGHLHLSVDGRRDLEEDADVRLYLIAGTDHLGGAVVPSAARRTPPNPANPILVWRALLEAARRWVCDGIEPPASRVPRVADGTAVPREKVIERFDAFDWALTPRQLRQRWNLDVGPDSAAGVVAVPPRRRDRLAVLVSDVDANGNEIAGVRMPHLAGADAIYTPWSNPDDLGSSRASAGFFGCRIPFATIGMDEREVVSDAERSVRIRNAAKDLVSDGFILPEDEVEAVENALELSGLGLPVSLT